MNKFSIYFQCHKTKELMIRFSICKQSYKIIEYTQSNAHVFS